MKRKLQLMMAAVMTLLSACNGPNSDYNEFEDRVNTKGLGHKYAQPDYEDEFVLGPGDTLSIQIANNPTLDSQQPILAEGGIQAPFVGQVKVAGLTSSQIQNKLQILLSPYIRNVAVVVVPLAIVSKKIYVFSTDIQGSLRARSFPLPGDFTLIDLVSAVGGITFLSDGCHVKVIRGDPRHPKVLDVNLYDMIINGYTAANIRLRPDDMVFFEPTFFARIAQTLNQVTLPLRVISQSFRDAADTVLFLQTGTIPNNRRNRR